MPSMTSSSASSASFASSSTTSKTTFMSATSVPSASTSSSFEPFESFEDEVTQLEKRFGIMTVRKNTDENNKNKNNNYQADNYNNNYRINIFEKEKIDYIFCLNATLDIIKNYDNHNNNKSKTSSSVSDFVLLVEDDAYPHQDIFAVLHSVIISVS